MGLLVGLVDYVCLREAGAVVRRLASLRLLTDMLHLFPQGAVTQVRLDMPFWGIELGVGQPLRMVRR